MRDIEVIESELRLVAIVRRSIRELSGVAPPTDILDSLLDERHRTGGSTQ
jgi:hypothetical protein